MSMRRIAGLAVLVLWTSAAGASAQALVPGAALPALEGETLAEAKITLPTAAAGAPAVLVFSFSRGAGEKAGAWTTALARRYAGGPVTSWSVVSLQAAPRFIRGMIRGGMRKDTPPAQQGRVVCVYKDDALWKQRLGVKGDEFPVIVVLDASGAVRWIRQAAHDAAAEAAVADQVLASQASRVDDTSRHR